jgi:threonine/homoserine/homoserine lactone efflux protein
MTGMHITLPWRDFAVVWAFLAVNILTPGPNVINTIAAAMGGGRIAGMGSAAGVGVGIGLWCLGMALGMSALFSLVPMLQTMLGFVAIGLLALFSTRYLRSAWAGWRGQRKGLPVSPPQDGFGQAFGRSMLVNALNPKALTSWLTILSIFPIAQARAGDIALLWAGACTAAFVIHTGYAFVFSTPAAARFYLRAGWVVSGLAGIFFAGFALKLLVGLVES